MLSKIPNLKFTCPFDIYGGTATATDEYKHKPLSEIDTTGKDILCVIRKMDAWYLSYMIGQAMHYRLNKDYHLEKVDTGKTYKIETKIKVPKLLPPELMAHSTFPDFQLKQMLGDIDPHSIKWLRQEHLVENLAYYLQFEDPFVIESMRAISLRRHSYKRHTPTKYWNKHSLAVLYKNNPIWFSLESILYNDKV